MRLTLRQRTDRAVKVYRAWAKGAKLRDLAAEYGVSLGTITRWTHDGHLVAAVRTVERRRK